jgi:hypothetical protein
MSAKVVQTRCECQATLFAELTADRCVAAGYAARAGKRETSPAHSINKDGSLFDVGWLCPYCGRNVMRTFAATA